MSHVGYRIIFFGISDRGLQRANNEDHFIVADLTRKVIGVRDNRITQELLYHGVGERGTLLAVADGLGGYDGGEVASQIAVETTANELFHENDNDSTSVKRLAKAVEKAHDAICRHQINSGLYTRMGSTLTAIHITHGMMAVAQVGDSRAYVWCDGKLTPLTQDQTVACLLRKQGVLTDEEAARHPCRHVLLQALGQGKTLLPDIRTLPFKDGDCVLLCTDGLSSYVDHGTIETILASNVDEEVRCSRLIEAANGSGGADNVTVLLARLMMT
jgi:protein phosphatase